MYAISVFLHWKVPFNNEWDRFHEEIRSIMSIIYCKRGWGGGDQGKIVSLGSILLKRTEKKIITNMFVCIWEMSKRLYILNLTAAGSGK